MSTLGRILGTAGVVTGVLGAAALGGVTAQRVAVRKYQSAQSHLDAILHYDPTLTLKGLALWWRQYAG